MKKATDDAEMKAQRAEALFRGASRTVGFKTAQLEQMKEITAKQEKERDDAREARPDIQIHNCLIRSLSVVLGFLPGC